MHREWTATLVEQPVFVFLVVVMRRIIILFGETCSLLNFIEVACFLGFNFFVVMSVIVYYAASIVCPVKRGGSEPFVL